MRAGRAKPGSKGDAGTVNVAGRITGIGTYTQTAGLTKLQGGSIEQSFIDVQGGALLGSALVDLALSSAFGGGSGGGSGSSMSMSGGGSPGSRGSGSSTIGPMQPPMRMATPMSGNTTRNLHGADALGGTVNRR